LFPAGVSKFFPDSPLEESFTTLTTVDPVVFAGCPITANTAEML